MANFFGLEQLARFAPQIFGRALSMDGVMSQVVASSGRHDHLDRHTHELRAALEALSQLYTLALSSALGYRHASVMAFAHVVCGEEARGQGDTWVTVALKLVPPKKPRHGSLSPEERSRYQILGLALYGAARAEWRAL